MKLFDWNNEKNDQLKQERNVGFEDVLLALEENRLLDILTSNKYLKQKVYVIEISGYIYLCPFVETEEKIFLKTLFPSRAATKQYIIGSN
jgi:hypothetical protein